MKIKNAKPTFDVIVNKRAICTTIDTGFNGQLAVTANVARKLALSRDPKGVQVGYGAFGERREVPALAMLEAMQIEGLTHRDVRLMQAPGNDSCSNLLGMEILSRYRLIIDLPNSRVWLLPRSTVQ